MRVIAEQVSQLIGKSLDLEYLTAFDPGNGWRYFPSVGELLVTFAILSVETTVFVFFVKKFPILPAARRPAAPAPAAREAS